MAIQTGRMASSSYVKLFFPCSESGADIDPLDVITGAQTNLSGVNAGDGLEVTVGIQGASTTITAGSFPTISASQSCILLATIGAFGGFSTTAYGDLTTGERITFTESATTVTVSTSAATVQITDAAIADGTNPHDYAIAVNRGSNVEYLVDGVVTGTPIAEPGGTINPAVDELVMGNGEYYAYTLFVFPGELPADYKEALAWMSLRTKVGQKVIWPAWEDK